jgi:hypothetical protein
MRSVIGISRFELFDSCDGLFPQHRRVVSDLDLTNPLDVRNAAIERFNELSKCGDCASTVRGDQSLLVLHDHSSSGNKNTRSSWTSASS